MRLLWAMVIVCTLTSCSSLLSSLNPLASKGVEVNAQVGKENEQNKIKLEATSSINSKTIETVNQADPFLIILLALGFGLAIPSPTIWAAHRREIKYLKERILYEQSQRDKAIDLTRCSSGRVDLSTTSD